MKKVLYINHTYFIGGAGWCLYQLVKSIPKELVERIVVLPAEGDLSAAFEEIGVRVIIDSGISPLMGNTNSRNFFHPSDIRFFMRMRKSIASCERICREVQPDIVHLNSSVLFPLAIGAKKANVPRVLLHIREHWVLKWWDFREWLIRYCVPRFVDSAIAISKTSATLFTGGVNTVVVYDWPDFEGRDEVVDIYKKYSISSEKKIILLPGGRNKIKDSLTALRAMKHVDDPDVVVLLLGGGADQDVVKRWIRALLKFFGLKTYGMKLDAAAVELGDRIRVLPFTRAMKSLIAQSCMVISPFTTPHFSMPSIEAASLKKPSIISDNGHARETVIDGKTGIIVPPGNEMELAHAINKLLQDDERCERFGEMGSVHVCDNFSKEASVKKVLDEYFRQ